MSLEQPRPTDVGETADGDVDYDELVEKLADQIDEEDLVMRYNWADSP